VDARDGLCGESVAEDRILGRGVQRLAVQRCEVGLLLFGQVDLLGFHRSLTPPGASRSPRTHCDRSPPSSDPSGAWIPTPRLPRPVGAGKAAEDRLGLIAGGG